jgi:excisionase family DNA binding protein
MTNIVQMNYEDLQAAIKTCLRDAVEEIKAIPEPKKLPDRCTLPAACEITGLSQSAIYKMSMDGTIPKEKYGKRLVFSRKALNEWMENRTISAPSASEVMENRLAKSAKKHLQK